MNRPWVISEDGEFFGEVKDFRVVEHTKDNKKEYQLAGNYRSAGSDFDDFDCLAVYPSKELALRQINNIYERYEACVANEATAMMPYDLRKNKLHD